MKVTLIGLHVSPLQIAGPDAEGGPDSDAGSASDIGSDSGYNSSQEPAADEYHPEKIIDGCKVRGVIKYCVKWLRFSDLTWEKRNSAVLRSNKPLLEEYHAQQVAAGNWPPTKTWKDVQPK